MGKIETGIFLRHLSSSSWFWFFFFFQFCSFYFIISFFSFKFSVISSFKELQQQLPYNKQGAMLLANAAFFSFLF